MTHVNTIDETTPVHDTHHNVLDKSIDHNSKNDPKKAGVGGAVAGAVVGVAAGGPVGAVIGAVAGGVASDAAVAGVDKVDHDGSPNEHATTRHHDVVVEKVV